MKSISVSENLHKWIMDNKNHERTSAEKVIYGLIGEMDCLKKRERVLSMPLKLRATRDNKTRQKIQTAGHELYERLGKISKSLQYIAGEIMSGNEEYLERLQNDSQPLTIGAEHILNKGFTQNQIEFLTTIEKELVWDKQEVSRLNDQLSMIDADGC